MKLSNFILLLVIFSIVFVFGYLGLENKQTCIPTPNLIVPKTNSRSHPKPGRNQGIVSEIYNQVRTPILGVTAKCKDGHYSRHQQNACSHHGGVAEWYGETPAT